MAGWIKLHKQIMDWEWYDDNNTFKLFIHCLLKANHEPKQWRGVIINRGTFVTSLGKLSTQSNLSIQQIRTSLDKLKSNKEITHRTTNKYSIITICKYETYQARVVEGQQTGITKPNKQITTTKEYKNKEERNKKENTKRKGFIKPKKPELLSYCKEKGYGIDVDYFISYYESNGWKVGRNKMVSWKATLASWNSRDKNKTPVKAKVLYRYKCPNCNKPYTFKEQHDYYHRCTENECQEIPKGTGMVGHFLEFDRVVKK